MGRFPQMRTAHFRAYVVGLTLLVAVLAAGAATETNVVLLHTNDIHGHILAENGAGGLAMAAAIVKSINPDLLLDAGDMFTGTLLSDTYSGEPVIALMNRMGYDASILGNHEFDYGLDMLRERIRQADFPVLSANVRLPVEEVGTTTVISAKGIRFGIIGLTTEEAPVTTHPKFMKNVEVIEIVRAIEQNLPALRTQSDFIIALGHLRPDEESRIARAFPEIRLVIGGHVSEALPRPRREFDTIIARTGRFAEYVGRIDLTFEDREIRTITGALIPVRDVAPDPEAMELIQPYQSRVDARMRTVLGEATAAFTKTSIAESPLFNLVTDAFRIKTGAQIGLTNPGGIRTDLPAGPITYGKVFEILPFENTLVTMKISGAALKRTLATDITAVSGLRVVFDNSKPSGERLVSVTLADGSPIVDDARYTVTINDFMQAGGDNYVEFANGTEVVDTGVRLRDVVSEYISAQKTISPERDGRVQILR